MGTLWLLRLFRKKNQVKIRLILPNHLAGTPLVYRLEYNAHILMSRKRIINSQQLQQLGDAPRQVSLLTRLYLRLCSTATPLYGWLATGFCFICALFPLHESELENNVLRIQDVAGIGVCLLLGSIFFYYFPIRAWIAGNKSIRLLQNGIANSAKYVGEKTAGIRFGSNYVKDVRFKYHVEGKTYKVFARALDTSRLTDEKYKVVLYDPMEPRRSIVLDGLPVGIRFDELTGRFWVNPLRLVLPLLAATIVCGEIIAIIVLAIKAF